MLRVRLLPPSRARGNSCACERIDLGMTKLGFLSFGNWMGVTGSRTRSGGEALL